MIILPKRNQFFSQFLFNPWKIIFKQKILY